MMMTTTSTTMFEWADWENEHEHMIAAECYHFKTTSIYRLFFVFFFFSISLFSSNKKTVIFIQHTHTIFFRTVIASKLKVQPGKRRKWQRKPWMYKLLEKSRFKADMKSCWGLSNDYTRIQSCYNRKNLAWVEKRLRQQQYGLIFFVPSTIWQQGLTFNEEEWKVIISIRHLWAADFQSSPIFQKTSKVFCVHPSNSFHSKAYDRMCNVILVFVCFRYAFY